MGFNDYSNAQSRRENPQKDQKREKLLKLAEEFHKKYELQRAEVERVAKEKVWVIREETEEGVSEIQYIDKNGMPQYYITQNLNAARTINTDDLWVGGSLGLNRTGSGFTIGEWDGGGVRTTHQEFDGRVTQKDSPGSTSSHSTHVAGTLIAQGQVNTAHGMAYEANLDTYDWDDDNSEMATAAANGLTISNHSYGSKRGWYYNGWDWYWYGDISISTTEDYKFGFYDNSSQEWDQIAADAPGYLIVKSAGNDRIDDHVGGHYYWNGSDWTWSIATRDPDGGTDGYDCIDQQGVAKNVLTIGAVDDIIGGWTQPSDVIMSSFSSWGPTDDGRIKPDLVANGVDVFSTDDDADDDYRVLNGTSMSTPSVTGTLALLQDYYESLRGGFMSSATLKGLAINTANEAGPNDGPDYMFGWGLMNASGAADIITDDDANGGLIIEGILVDGETIDYTYYCDGVSDINVTMCWTDPPGTPTIPYLNPPNFMLVNNLDLTILDESSNKYYAWMLSPSNPAEAATHSHENWRDNVEVVNIQSPSAGYYTLRIDCDEVISGGQQAYALIVAGLSTPPAGTYCAARSNNEAEYISNVSMGDIDNTTDLSPGGYMNFTGLKTNILKGTSETITVTLGNYYTGDDVYVWVDWNQDGDFSDAGEDYSLGSPPYSTTITVPTTAITGYTTMRVRMVYSYSQSPCGNSNYGETEDYSIYVMGFPGLWTGEVDQYWYHSLNWDDRNVPTSLTDVTIPSGTPHQPTIGSGILTINAYCNDLTIQSGAVLTQTGTSTHKSFFHVSGNFNSDAGTFTQNSDYTFLYFEGSSSSSWDDDTEDDTYTMVRVEKTGNNYVNMWQDMTVKSFEIREGIFKIDAQWTLTVTGTTSFAFQVENGGVLTLTDETIDVTSGGVEFVDGSQADVSGGTIRCGGEFIVEANATYDIQFSGGTVEMYGSSTSQYIEDHDGNTKLYNLVINKSTGTCTINYGDLYLEKNLTINSGTLDTYNYDIYIGGDWTNNVGTSGFVEGTSRVIFNGGDYNQSCSNETFNELEINKPLGGDLRINGTSVTCAAYDWTAGAIVVLTGNFTANDLLDNAVQGTFLVNAGGTINLTNSGTSTYVDLKGDLHIFGGTMNVTGSVSWWPYQEDASIEMNGGVLDFTSCGITISNSYNLTSNITGGTIRIAGGFEGNRGDFTPAGGIVEFYGETNANFNQSNGCTLYSVNIDKASKEASNSNKAIVTSAGRIDKTIGEGKDNTISLISDILLTNDLDITSGSMTIGTHTLTIDGDCNIDGLMDVGATGNVLNHGLFELGTAGTLTITGGSFVNDRPYGTKAWQDMDGTFNLSAGLFEIMYNSIRLESSFVDNVTGGNIRTGHSFYAIYAGTFEPTGGTFEFTGTGGTPYIDCDAGNYFNDLNINSTVNYNLYANTEVRGNVIINNGSLSFNSIYADDYDMSCLGNVDINSGGTMSIGENSTLKLDDGSNLVVAAGGEIRVVGTAGNEAAVTRISTGAYNFSIYGSIAAQYATFEYMDASGVFLQYSATVDAGYPFNHCIFRNGAPSPSALLATNSTSNFTADDCYFENTEGNTQYNVWKNSSSGNITFNDYSGDFAGPEFEYDPNNQVFWGPVDVEMSLNVMLEGPYNGSDMNTDLNTLGLIPLSQPFNSIPSADWFYSGSESVASIPPNVVDWVLVKIKDANSAASSTSAPVVAVQAAFLLNDGSIVDLDGSDNLQFTGISYSSGLFPVVWHRNHLGVISANRMTRTGGVYTYDFTAAGSAYGDTNPGEKSLGGGVYGMYGGDASGSGLINSTDVLWWQNDAGLQNYLEGDINLDSQADNKDKNDFCVPNFGNKSQIPGSKSNDN